MATLHVLRVFSAADGSHGNPLGVFLHGGEVPAERRQAVARELGFSETVFVDDLEQAAIRIFTPEIELPFAGHPCVGTAWLLREEHAEPVVLRTPAGEVRVRREAELTWIAAKPAWAPPFDTSQLDDAAAVETLDGPSGDAEWLYCWAWEDEDAGRIRARSFVAEAGIAEDEATGAAALLLCGEVGRPIEIRQGKGSDIFARPLDDGWIEVGGRVVPAEVREHAVS